MLYTHHRRQSVARFCCNYTLFLSFYSRFDRFKKNDADELDNINFPLSRYNGARHSQPFWHLTQRRGVCACVAYNFINPTSSPFIFRPVAPNRAANRHTRTYNENTIMNVYMATIRQARTRAKNHFEFHFSNTIESRAVFFLCIIFFFFSYSYTRISI